MAEKAKQAGDRHRNKLLSVRPSDALRELLEELAQQERRSLSQMVVLLLEDALKARGHSVPPSF